MVIKNPKWNIKGYSSLGGLYKDTESWYPKPTHRGFSICLIVSYKNTYLILIHNE